MANGSDTRTMDSEDIVSPSNFESLLDEDSTFVEFFNSFLALSMFPIRLHYNPDTGCFEEFKHKLADDIMDDIARRATSVKRISNIKSTLDAKAFKIGYYVKFLEKEGGIDWVKKNRLPLFLRSEICAEYKLARSLSNAQTRFLMNILIDSSNLGRTAFDENAGPKFRTHRNRGALPGLAEFQQQFFTEREDGSENNSIFGGSSFVGTSVVSDNEVVEFSEIDHEKLTESGEGCSLKVPLHSPGNGAAPVVDLKENIENGDKVFADNVLSREEEVPDKSDFRKIENEESKKRVDEALDEAHKGISMLELEEEEDNLDERKYVDNYNILTVVDSLKGMLRDAQELSIPENVKEEICKEDENEDNNPGIGFVKYEAVSEILREEECTIQVPHLQAVIGEETDINNNEVIDSKSETDIEANDVEESNRTTQQSDLLGVDSTRQCWTGDDLKSKTRCSSGLLKNVPVQVQTHGIPEDQPILAENVNNKFSRKRHSMPYNNRLVLQDFQLSPEENQLSAYRRQSMPITETLISAKKRQSRGSIEYFALHELTSILLTKTKDLALQERLQSFCEETEGEDESESGELYTEPRRPINIASKMGMDAFKLFLIDTPGEKLFLLWIEIEKLKTCESVEKRKSLVQEIRNRFFRSGAAHELKMETVRQWNVLNFANIGYDTLVEIQGKIQAPLEQYWCARFTFHQKHRKTCSGSNYVSNNHHCTKSRCSTHRRELTRVPQRPNTCFPNLRTKQKLDRQAMEQGSGDSKVLQASDCKDGKDEGSRTKAKIRSQSAHPRLINTSSIKDVNLSYKQLQIMTTIDEGCGFKALPYCKYKRDASNSDEKANVRLYIQPLPPSNCTTTTVERSHTNLPTPESVTEKELIESVVDCLLHEKNSGSFFYQHLQQKSNQLALDCYNFWKALQDYNEHFFSESFHPGVIKQKAGFIFTTYITSGSQHNIKCPSTIQDEIYHALDPPYEDLFDKAEGHAMRILSTEYGQLLLEENDKYEEIKKNEKIKYLDVRATMRKPKFRPNENRSEEDEEEDEEDPREKISVEELNLPLPAAADGVSFESFIRNKSDLESFKEFLDRTNNKGLRDLLAWTEMENFRRSTRRNNQRNILAKSVRSNWLNSDYFFGSSSPATKEAQAEVRRLVEEPEIPERPPSPIILEAQKYVRARIERRWFMMFKETQSYQNKIKENNINEMVEDMIMKRRLQRSEAAWKILNSRWVSGSRDVIALRQTLADPVKCDRFRKFLSLKGDLMDHNVYFWFEVQKYKELCHRHVEISIIKAKVQAIIDVFIKSSVPPELQIDVPIEIAERLHEKATGRMAQLGPYLFREAQTTVFRIMFNHWKEYLTFHASIEETKLSQHLEELHKKLKAEIRAKRMIADRRKLAKVAYEKRKKEREERERLKEKPKIDATSTFGHEKTISLISDEEETAFQTKSFSYSKFTIEQQLQKLEKRMREEGYTVEEFTEGDFAHSYFNASSEKKLSKKFSGIDDQKSMSGVSYRTHRKRRESLWKANRNDSLLKEPIAEFVEESAEGRLDERGGSSCGPSFRRMSGFDGISRAGTSVSKRDQSAVKSRKITAPKGKTEQVATNDIDRRRSLMPGPQRAASFLTVQSLQEFDKSLQGKPLASPLPLVHISSITGKTVKGSKKTKSVTSSFKVPARPSFPSRRKELTNSKRRLEKVVVT